jgi:hypothetical protein
MAGVLLSLVLGVAVALCYRCVAGQPLPRRPGPFGGSRAPAPKGQKRVTSEGLGEAFLYVYALAMGFLARELITEGQIDSQTIVGLGVGFVLSLSSRVQRNAPHFIQAWTAGPPAQVLCWRARGASTSRRAWDDIVAALREGRSPDVDGTERVPLSSRPKHALESRRRAIVTSPDGREWRVRRWEC